MNRHMLFLPGAAAMAALCLAGRGGAQVAPPTGVPPPPPPPPPFFAMPAITSEINPYMLLRRSDVQEHLHLTLEQKNTINDPNNEANRAKMALRITQDSGSDPADFKKQIQDQLDAQSAGLEDKLKKLLTPEQYARFQEIRLQWTGPLILAQPTVAKRLKIFQEHLNPIAQLSREYQVAKQEIMKDLMQQDQQTSPDGSSRIVKMTINTEELNKPLSPYRRKLVAAKKAAEAKIMEILSDEERSAWKTALGAPFTFSLDIPGMRF